MTRNILAQFKSENGETLEAPFDLPLNVTVENLQLICNALMKKSEVNATPYTFFVQEKEITSNLGAALKEATIDSEKVLEIIYQPQAVFQVRAVTRCTRCVLSATVKISILKYLSLLSVHYLDIQRQLYQPPSALTGNI
jgi:NLE (NUC135) domain